MLGVFFQKIRQDGSSFGPISIEELFFLPFFPARVVEFDDAVPVCRVGKLNPEDLSIVFCLLQSVSSQFVRWLGFDDSQHEILRVTQQVVGAFRRTPARLTSYDDDACIGEAFLFAYLVIVPPRAVEFRQNVFSAGVGFSDHKEVF
jgi:hypothetical protein